MAKKFDLQGDIRKRMVKVIEMQETIKALEKAVKAEREAIMQELERFGHTVATSDKTDTYIGSMALHGKEVYAAIQVTAAIGSMDYKQAYIDAFGHEPEETYRKPSTIRRTFRWATTKEIKEIGRE